MDVKKAEHGIGDAKFIDHSPSGTTSAKHGSQKIKTFVRLYAQNKKYLFWDVYVTYVPVLPNVRDVGVFVLVARARYFRRIGARATTLVGLRGRRSVRRGVEICAQNRNDAHASNNRSNNKDKLTGDLLPDIVPYSID